MKLTEAQREMLYTLDRWGPKYGYGRNRTMAILLRRGLAETFIRGGSPTIWHRITPAGRAALEQEGK